jgi:hypothetical protein
MVELIMSTDAGSMDRQNVPVGLSRCAIKSIIDFGTQPSEWGDKHQLEITFEFPDHLGTFDEEEKPLFISKRFTLSLHPKSTLAKSVVSMFGKPLPKDFNIYSLIGKNISAMVIHTVKDGVTYANIDNFAPLQAGLPHIEQEGQISFLLGMADQDQILNTLPEWKQQRIRAAKDYLPF